MYTVMFFKLQKEHGATGPAFKDQIGAKNWAEVTMAVNGADSYAIYKEGVREAVYLRRPNA